MLSNINLNLLKYFYEVVTVKNITKASQNLLISQPAISRAIRELENELNVKLLERSKMGVIPTPEGEILYNHIKNMFYDFNNTLNTIEETKKSGGTIHIGTTTTNFLEFISKALYEFKRRFPNVNINIVLEEINTLDEMKRLGKLDILIKNDYEYLEGFQKIKSFEMGDCFVAAKNNFSELIDKELTLDEILKYPMVLLSPITTGRKNFDNFLKSQNIKYKPTYEFNSYSLCRELIRNELLKLRKGLNYYEI